MRPPPTGRGLIPLLASSFVITAGAAFALWVMARSQVPGYLVWVLAAAVSTLGVAGWLVLRQAAAAIATARAQAPPLKDQLDKALARIKALTNSHGRVVGSIAHEIKTPLTIVVSQAELLLGCSDDPAAVRGYAKSIGEETRHVSDLVESFLRLARPFAQEDTSHHIPLYLQDFVLEAVRRSQSLGRECGVSIVPNLAESSNGDAEMEVMGDSVLLEAMIENLVRNAVRFSPRGSRVEVQVKTRGESILLEVRDHGTGIAAEFLDSVFDWFFQVPDLMRHSGSGFGLAIAKRIAEHHRGTISLRNHPQGGCEFEVTLPRWRDDGESPVAVPPLATPA